jgi:hypothetical protein
MQTRTLAAREVCRLPDGFLGWLGAISPNDDRTRHALSSATNTGARSVAVPQLGVCES